MATQKWEYCAIDGLRSQDISYRPKCYRITERGFEVVTDFKDRPKGVSETDALGQFIARLGDEGWELVGAGNIGETTHRVYFKRPKA